MNQYYRDRWNISLAEPLGTKYCKDGSECDFDEIRTHDLHIS